MIHRVDMGKPIQDVYHSRNLVIYKKQLVDLIETLSDKGLSPGTIEDTINDNKRFHLTFDDGYAEHLKIAKLLKNDFSLDKHECTFCINVGNSVLKKHSGMDLIYHIISMGKFEELVRYAKNKDWQVDSNIDSIKERYISLSPSEINEFISHFALDRCNIGELYLDEKKIKKLSELFNIASHGITHRDLRNHLEISKVEISDSKKRLEKIVGSDVPIMCYPEGKNDDEIQKITKRAGYEYGLSITHSKRNKYSIGRYCVNRQLDLFIKNLK